MAMKRIHIKQLTLALSIMGVMALAASILVWGSEYKCSLYHRHPEKHTRIPVAKLLSERERPVAAEAMEVVRASLLQAASFAVGVLLFGLFCVAQPGFDWPPLVVRNDPAADRARCLIHFSFRPPPAMAA